MAPRTPLVLGGDGLPQQLQSADSIGAAIGYAQSLGASGYQKLPSGLIMQWGQTTPTSGVATVTFPIAFPTACTCVLSSPILAGVGTGVTLNSFTLTSSTTGCTIAVRSQTGLTTGVSTAPVQWQVLGY